MFGGFAGLCGQFVAYPLHVVRRRFQVGTTYHDSIVMNLIKIYQVEGIAGGLYKGFALSLFKGPVMTGIAFTVNEYFKRRIQLSKEDDLPWFPLLAEKIGEVGWMKHHHQKNQDRLSAIESLISGALAGATAKTITAPMDRVKVMFQTNSAQTFSFSNAIKCSKDIYQTIGITGFWRGNFATCMKVMPHAATTYTTFDRYKEWLENYLSPTQSRFLGGSLAGMTGTLVTYPLDLMRTRMAAHWGSTPKYSGYINALQTISQTEGVMALYSGIYPSLVGIIPYSGIAFGMYETGKAVLAEKYEEPPVYLRLIAGGVSGLVAQVCVYPLETVRRRQQVSPTKIGIIKQILEIAHTEGIQRGVFKGLSLNFIKSPIAISTSFTVRDFLKRKIIEEKNRD